MKEMDRFTELKEQADNGDADAMYQIAMILLGKESGTGEPDPDSSAQAMRYLKAAIKAGNTAAMNQMGAMYYEGSHVPQDYRKAIYWYKKAADAGEIISMTNLGYCYYYGRDTAVDMKKAYQYFSKAALFGERGALYKVGDMYLNGYFVKKDEAAAFHLYLRCYQSFEEIEDINDEDVYSGVCLRLARCLYEGIGAVKNLDAACDFVNRAIHFFRIRYRRYDIFCEDGFRQAKKLRDMINAELEEQDAHRDEELVSD